MDIKEKKLTARSLFLNTDLTRKQIAAQAGCTELTLRRWISRENWDSQKQAKSITRGELLRDSYAQLKAVNQAINESGGVPNKEQSDAKSIIRKEIEALGDSPIHRYIEVFEEYIAFVSHHNPEKLQWLSTSMQRFLTAKTNGSI